MRGLAGKVGIVTGGSRGIGLAIARRLVDEGARVCVTGRNAETLAAATATLGDAAIAVAGNAADPQHREEVVSRTVEAFGSIDLLVNNAGINPVYGPLLDLDLEVARKTVEVNDLAVLGWVQQVCRTGMSERGGAVVNIASAAGVRHSPGIAFYGATKAMLISLTASLAVELGPTVRVNAVAPAVVKTRFAEALFEGREAEVAAGYPLGRLGEPADIASAVAYLLSEESGWVTGQTVVLDGGALHLTGA